MDSPGLTRTSVYVLAERPAEGKTSTPDRTGASFSAGQPHAAEWQVIGIVTVEGGSLHRLRKKSLLHLFWVAQRFTAAVIPLFAFRFSR